MSFKKIGTAEVLEILDFKKTASLSDTWQEIVKSTKELDINEVFEFDKDNFLYFKSRSISAGEKYGANQNGDYFSRDELKKSYKSFIGKGFYIEHDSDDPVKAKGIILTATYDDTNDYITNIVAVDRRKFPDVARRIESKELNAVSMGCICDEAQCSICQNIAHNEIELCGHMMPRSSNYIKGREVEAGKIAYEINKGVRFTELSGVKMPADRDALIKTILAKKEGEFMAQEILDKITAKDYFMLKKALEEQDTESFEKRIQEIVEKAVNTKINSEVRKVVTEEINKQLGTTVKEVPSIVKPVVEETVKDMKIDVQKEISEIKEEVAPAAKTEVKPEAVAEASKQPKTAQEGKPVEIILGDGFSLKSEAVKDKILLRLYDRDQATNVYIDELAKDMSEAEKIAEYRKILHLEPQKVEIPKEARKEDGNMFSLVYIPGETLEKSYFVGREGKSMKVVRASLIVPKDVQEKIVKGSVDVINPEDALEHMKKECNNSFEGWVKWISRHAKLNKRAYDFFAVNEGEIEYPKLPGRGEVERSLNEKEVNKEKPSDTTRTDGTAVKKYFQRFPSRTVSAPERAINLESNLKKANEEIAKLKIDLDAKVKEIETAKKEAETIKTQMIEKAKVQDVEKLIHKIKESGLIENDEEEKKLREQFSSFNEENIGILEDFLKKVSKASPTTGPDNGIAKDANVPSYYEQIGTESKINDLIDIWQNMTIKSQ